MISKGSNYHRFALGEPIAFRPRTTTYVTGAEWTNSGGTPDTYSYTPFAGETITQDVFVLSGTDYLEFVFTGSSVDLLLWRDSTYGTFSVKLKPYGLAAIVDVWTPLSGRTCYGNVAAVSPDTIRIVEELPSDTYVMRIAPSSGSTVAIAGAIVYSDLSTTIQDPYRAFIFDVNPNQYDESIMGGQLENNLAGTPILTETHLSYREISLAGNCISATESFRLGGTKFIQDMRNKFERYANMQTKLYLITDLGINNRHLVYIMPDSFSVERRQSPASPPSYTYSMTLREVRR